MLRERCGKLRESQCDISGAEVLMNDQMLEEHVDITREAIEKLIRMSNVGQSNVIHIFIVVSACV